MKIILYNYIKFESVANVIYQRFINDLTISKFTGLIFRAISTAFSFLLLLFAPKRNLDQSIIIFL